MVRVLLALRQESHDDLAAALGVTRPAVSARLNGRTPWSLGDLDRLADHYGVGVDYFLRTDLAAMSTAAMARGGPLLDPRGRRRRQDRPGDGRSDGADGSAAAARVRGVPVAAAEAV